MELVSPSILTLIYIRKYNGNIEGGLSSKKYNKALKHFHSVFKKKAEFS